FVAQRILISEKGAEFLYACSVEESRKPESQKLARYSVRVGFEVASRFVGVPRHDAVQDLVGFLLRCLRKIAVDGRQLFLDASPERSLVFRIYPPAIPLHALLFTVYRNLQFIQHLFRGGTQLFYLSK